MKRLAGLWLLAAFILSSCGGYYYRATVQGFVVNDDSDTGVNEATVRIYTSEVSDPTADGFVSSTSTVTQGGNDGYYSSTVIWNNWFGAYGGEGDTTEIWLGISHPDFADRVVRAEGILSDDNNLVATIRMEETTFRLDELRGRVVDSNGEGVNGVRMVLDLPQVSGTDEREDRVVQSATVDGQTGTFAFGNVEWNDTNTAAATGELTAVIRVDDTEWGDPANTGNPDPADDFTLEESVVLLPADQPRTLASTIEIARLPRTEFTATVSGRVLERLTDGPREGVQGVEVTLVYVRQTDGGPETETLITTSDGSGTFAFTVTWIDNAPRDFDDADEQTGATQGGETDGIDPGEDGLEIDITYGIAGGIDFSENPDTTTANLTDVRITSNPAGGVYNLPDNIQPTP